MNMKKGWYKGALLACFVTPWCQAMMVDDLYEATRVSEASSAEQRDIEAMEGLKQVFLKVTGNASIFNRPAIQKALADPKRYVLQYASSGGQIHFKYNAQEIDYLLKSEGIKIWGQQRPLIVLWVAAQTPAGRVLLGSETDQALSEALNKMGKEKGVPLLLPILDLEDVTAVTTTDIWGGFSESVKKASERYSSDTILMGHIQMINDTPAEWAGEWQLISGDATWQWTAKGQNIHEVIEKSVVMSLPYLADRYGIEENQTSKPITLRIEGIQSLQDYAAAEAYLRELSVVKQVEPQQIGPAGAIFKVIPYGQKGLQALKNAIQLDPQLSKLASLESGFADESDTSDLRFRWVR
ncbi:MAG: DUF2066 domain-containing protein [Gammaproteobacteria bacterium]